MSTEFVIVTFGRDTHRDDNWCAFPPCRVGLFAQNGSLLFHTHALPHFTECVTLSIGRDKMRMKIGAPDSPTTPLLQAIELIPPLSPARSCCSRAARSCASSSAGLFERKP
jgi:hypothetical protein